MDENTQQLLGSITALLEDQAQQDALDMLVTHFDTLQVQLDSPVLLTLLERFSGELPAKQLYVKGQALAQDGRYQEAIYTLHRAKALAWQQQLEMQVVNCCLELAFLYQRHEDFQTAFYYVQEAENVSDSLKDQEAKASLLLRLAELCPDIGQLNKSIEYAQDALHRYSLLGDSEGQFQALYLLAIVNRQMGRYDEASSRLEMARQCQLADRLPPQYYARILSAEAHLLWYQGRVVEALSKAQVFRQIASLNGLNKQHIYAHILLGNLYRDRGRYKEAEKWYSGTENLISQYELPLYLPWVEIQRGWLRVLMGELLLARRHIHLALKTDNRGMQMSFNVNLACLEIVDGQYQSAKNLLQLSRQFYAHSGDILSYHVIGLYLGHLHWQLAQQTEALVYLQQTFEWFTEHNILYFPNWWHPRLVAEVCIMALTKQICTPLVERIFLTHLPEYEHLLMLIQPVDTAIHQRILTLYNLLADNDGHVDVLATVTDNNVKGILQQLLQNGPLRWDTFRQLQQKLTTAKHRHKFNPTCIAVFGLYLQGFTRQQIATKIGCSPTTVRNYITVAYQAFDLPAKVGTGTLARKEELYQLAQTEGLVR